MTQVQLDYYNDQHRFLVTSAGRRSRKTLIGKRKTLTRAMEKPGNYFCGAPTHQQAKAIFWDDLKNNSRMFWSRMPSETELRVYLRNMSMIQVVGLDKPERIEGRPWNGCHITEVANLKPNAWASNIRPVLSDTNGWAILDGVPEGRNHYYDLVLYACNQAIPKTEPLNGAFAENNEWAFFTWFSADVLSPGEIISAKSQLDERTFRQEYEGSFEDVLGLLYYAYGIHNASDCQYDPKEIVHVGMDFNVNPMTATLSHVIGKEVFQFGEIYQRNSNTFNMRDELKSRFKPDGGTPERCYIYPDSTGKHGESNARESDLAILEKAGFPILAKSVNPYIKDRVAAMNSLMRSADKTVKYHVNVKNCPYTINDLTRVQATDDGREDKTQEAEGLVHISSALGYMVTYLFPVKERMFQ